MRGREKRWIGVGEGRERERDRGDIVEEREIRDMRKSGRRGRQCSEKRDRREWGEGKTVRGDIEDEREGQSE